MSDLNFIEVHKHSQAILEEFTSIVTEEPSSRERVLGAIMASATLTVMLTVTVIPDEKDAVDSVAKLISRTFESRRNVINERSADSKTSDQQAEV